MNEILFTKCTIVTGDCGPHVDPTIAVWLGLMVMVFTLLFFGCRK